MKILVFIGPSGSGKSTLIRQLQRRGIVEVTPSWTTRPPRENEAGAGIDHRFVSEERFSELQADGFFLEVIEMFGFRYGLPTVHTPAKGKVPAILVRAPLLELVSAHFPEHVVYQIESSLDLARERLAARQVSDSESQRRLASFADEVVQGRRLCHRVFDSSSPMPEVVDALERAIAEDFQAAPHVSSIGTITTTTRSDG